MKSYMFKHGKPELEVLLVHIESNWTFFKKYYGHHPFISPIQGTFEDIKKLASEVETHLIVPPWELGKRRLILEIWVFWGKLPGENSYVVCKRYIFFTTKEKLKLKKKNPPYPPKLSTLGSCSQSSLISLLQIIKKMSKTWKNKKKAVLANKGQNRKSYFSAVNTANFSSRLRLRRENRTERTDPSSF